MKSSATNLRKAAVLLRSVDADTAATLLAQLSTEEAIALREAVRALGPVNPEEQAAVLAEFRREKPAPSAPAGHGVELSLSSGVESRPQPAAAFAVSNNKRFEFLETAPINTLATYLAREHAQTIAVVLSHVAPGRAAAILAALPEQLQAETMERLSNLGETDADVVTVVESELAAWAKKRSESAASRGRRRDGVSSILAAADASTRTAIVANLRSRNVTLAEQVQPPAHPPVFSDRKLAIDEYRVVRSMAKRLPSSTEARIATTAPPARTSRPGPRVEFDHLTHADSRTLARLLSVADPNVLALALAGSSDELLDRVCDEMPKRVAKSFRRELRRMGPTRLSDVGAAQNAIADLMSQQIAERRRTT